MLNEPMCRFHTGRCRCRSLPGALTRDDGPGLSFTARGFEGVDTREFSPWFRLTHERYNLYWRSTPPAA